MERETDLWIKFLIPTETADMTILTMCSTGNMPMNRIMKKFFTTKKAAISIQNIAMTIGLTMILTGSMTMISK